MPATRKIDDVNFREWTLLFVLSAEGNNMVIHFVSLQPRDVIVDVCFGEWRKAGSKVQYAHCSNIRCDKSEELNRHKERARRFTQLDCRRDECLL